MLGGRKTVIFEFLGTGMISVMPVPLLSVHPRECSQQGHTRYVLSACVCRRFPFRKWHLLLWGMMNSKHSRCTYTLRFQTWQAGHGGTHFAHLPVCRNILGKQCTCGHTSCFLQISAPLPFAKTCWATSQTL